jgi:hypothetical protein
MASRVHADAAFSLEFRMANAPKLGECVKCICCKRRTAERVVSSGIAGIVRGHERFDVNMNDRYSTRINGTDVNFTFVDHKMGDPTLQRNLAAFARKQGIRNTTGLDNARYDPKSGRVLVDVVSNVKDPLGRIERAKQKGDVEYTKKHVGTPYKMRPRKAKVK